MWQLQKFGLVLFNISLGNLTNVVDLKCSLKYLVPLQVDLSKEKKLKKHKAHWLVLQGEQISIVTVNIF